MLAPELAWERIRGLAAPLSTVTVDRRHSLGYVLAEDLPATVDVPFADVSAMDGYVLAGSVDLAPAHPVVGVSAAGHPPDFELKGGEVAKIMTGAMVPPGGDRVVPVEWTDGGATAVRFEGMTEAGAHIRRRGEVVGRGDALLPAGHRLNPGSISLLASHGYGEVSVIRRPTVAVLTTGDEIVPPEQEPGPGQLRDSNSPFLLAAGDALGLDFEHLGNAGDRLGDLESRISAGLAFDVLLLCGGVSKGDYDLVEDVLEKLGCRKLYDALAIQPGKPMVACKHDGGWVFGLPGNPGSVMTTFHLFVRPLLDRLAGGTAEHGEPELEAALDGTLPPTKGRVRFFNASIESRDGRLVATPLLPKGSHDVTAFARGNGLIRVPADSPAQETGGTCRVLLFGGP